MPKRILYALMAMMAAFIFFVLFLLLLNSNRLGPVSEVYIGQKYRLIGKISPADIYFLQRRFESKKQQLKVADVRNCLGLETENALLLGEAEGLPGKFHESISYKMYRSGNVDYLLEIYHQSSTSKFGTFKDGIDPASLVTKVDVREIDRSLVMVNPRF